MIAKAGSKMFFLVSAVWFSIALLWMWLSHGWFRIEHQAWGIGTLMVFLATIGWLVPLSWGLIRLVHRTSHTAGTIAKLGVDWGPRLVASWRSR